MTPKRYVRRTLLLLAALCLCLPAGPLASASTSTPAETAAAPIAACADGAFSTEEDFIASDIKPFDGNLHISDGDVLSFNGDVCMRNYQLLTPFFIPTVIPPDLGLDALDILEIGKPVIAFSTEVDHPSAAVFTSGDLLFNTGWAIPNIALVKPFNITWDIGLDGVQFMGKMDDILRFVASLPNHPREQFLQNPGLLQALLKEHGIDIWFTVEGTAFIGTRSQVLDGDLLSAANGTIVVPQSALLPNDVPAGLPLRGVDFGLDAVVGPRDPERALKALWFSTEILYEGEKTPFTDGDALRLSNGVVRTNWDLIQPFHPAANFLGLDALSVTTGQEEPPPDPNIQSMCGELPVADFNGGLVLPGGPGTGLYRTNSALTPPGDPPRRPCGEFVPIDGYLPAAGVIRYRVAYRLAGDLRPAAGVAQGIQTHWRLKQWVGWPVNNCLLGPDLNTDGNGWMPAATYLAAKSGTLTGCANSGLRLAVWDTNNRLGLGPATDAERNAHYVLWLEWEDAGGILHQEPLEHHLQLDNTLPVIAPYPAGLRVHLPGSVTAVPACGEAPTGSSELEVWGQFRDLYYWNFYLEARGGNPPASAGYGPHNYYDPTDGPPGLKNTNHLGTTPAVTTVHLRDIDLALPPPDGLGASFKRCCYVLDLWVRDAAVRHTFADRNIATDNSGSTVYQAYAFVTFEAGP
jgi:hypothetical protein